MRSTSHVSSSDSLDQLLATYDQDDSYGNVR